MNDARPGRVPSGYHLMLGVGGLAYFLWWFAVEWLLPGSFNPLPGRLLVVAYFALAFILGYVSPWARRRAEVLYYVGALVLVGHYFYLFRYNAANADWAVGTYVVVFALFVGIAARRWLYAFGAVCVIAGLTVWLLEPALRRTIFLPGLVTVVALCLITLLGRIRLLASLSESTGRFQSLFDATFEGVAVQDGGIIIDVNASFVALFGYTREELIGRSVLELNAPEYRERVRARIRERPSSRYESVGLRKDGTRFAIEVSTKPHVYRGRALRLAAVRDVTDRQRAEQERAALFQEQTARASAQEAVRLRDEFISVASHELRTPITSLRLNLDGFVRRLHAGSEVDFEAYAVRAHRQLGRMLRLVEELLDVSRLGAGPPKLSREPIDLSELVRNVIDALADDLKRAGCETSVQLRGPLEGFWDRLRLEQVFENLLRNALIYGAGEPIAVTLTCDPSGDALLSVRDHGIGVDEALREKIFLRFERGVSAQHYGGFGLGLYIAKQIVEAHAGRIWVESEPGQGATFWVRLPVTLPDAAVAPASDQNERLSSDDRSS